MGDLLARRLHQMKAEGTLLQIESPFQISPSSKVCETTGPVHNKLSKRHETEVHVFSDYVLCLWKSVMAWEKMESAARVLQGHRKKK